MVDNNPDRLIVTPVSLADGLKRADGKTWKILLISGGIGVVLVLILNLFFESEPIQWGGGPPPAASPVSAPVNPGGAETPAKEEPRTYDVAPPGAAPQKK